MKARRFSAATAVLTLLVACTGPGALPSSTPIPAPSSSRAPGDGRIVLMTHDSFAIGDDVVAAFEQTTGNTVEILRGGDAGSMVNQAILTSDAPLADALFGVDNTFLSRALAADIFAAYRPAEAQALPEEFVLDPDFRVTPIDYGDVCVNYDKEAFAAVSAPTTLAALADPEFEGRLVVENAATSSPGLAFMLATIARFGEAGDYTWLDYWQDLVDNDVLVVPDWQGAYYTHFSGGAGEGDRPLVVSYATSPVAEVVFSDPTPAEAPTDVLTDGCFRQVEFAGVLRGAANRAGAEQLLDYMLTPEFQADIPLNMFVLPVRPEVELPDVFVEHAATVDQPMSMDPDEIDANRERWQREWTDVVIR